MFGLAYKSKASQEFGQEDIQFMLEQARDFNKQHHITGCLLYYQGKFLQYIEGNQEKILDLFDRIKVDNRHSEVTLLSYDYTSERVFHNWEMAYEDFLGATNHQLQYLRLMVALFIENPNTSLKGNPTSKSFWSIVQKLLISESIDR